jgi:fatty-acyl-CoA synthase
MPVVAGLQRQDAIGYWTHVSPKKLALVEIATGTSLTYAELDDRVARCTGLLRKLVPRIEGERVAALGRNSAAQIILAMACQRAGAVFVPLNWRLVAAELQGLVEDCDPALLVYDAEFADNALAAGQGIALKCFEGEAGLAAELLSAEPGLPTADHTHPFALLYTSGTTGRPKGVIVSRDNAFFASLNFAMVGKIGSRSVVLADLPLFHTIGLIAVTRTTLMMGGTLVVSDRFLASRTLKCLADPGIGVSHYFGVPQIATALRAEPAFDGRKLTRLHAIFLGGAPLPRPLLEAWLADGVPLVNGYGMSEAGTVVHMPIDIETIRDHPGAIGLPAPFQEIRIVGAGGIDVPDGEVGELCLRGPAVTPGYWRQPEGSAAAMTDGWFHTGDLVRRDAGGFLSLVDRLKDMYISGGENVFPAEVENVLLGLDGIADAAVVGVSDPRWGEVGVAFVALKHGANLSETSIRDHCAGRLARYKCPARLVFVPAIARTASGKVQKHVLRAGL